MAKRTVQGYLLRCSFGLLAERNGTVCKITDRADSSDEEGSLLEDGPAFWVKFGDSDDEFFVPGEFLSPWYAVD